MKSILLTLVLPLWAHLSAAATDPAWVAKDQKLIREVTALLKANPTAVERYFRKTTTDAHNLGFGWKSVQTSAPGGYISIDATFYYRHDSLVSYIIYPEVPRQPELSARYAQWYAAGFAVDPAGVLPFRYNGKALQSPLHTGARLYAAAVAPPAVAEYMSPESGVEYGDYGGFAMTMLQNRAAFTKIQDRLSPEQVLLLMHAINPASRLTAIEYYLRHKKLFANQPAIERWIETVFQELPEVESLNGCMGGKYSARALVAKFAKPR